MRRFLKNVTPGVTRSLLLTCFLSLSLHATVYEWGNPVDGNPTDPVANKWDGADTGWLLDDTSLSFSSETLAINREGTVTVDQTGIFAPNPTTYSGETLTGDKLIIKDNVRVQGDIELRFTGTLPATTHEFFEVDIGELGDTEPVTISAYNDATTTFDEGAQLIFNVAQGKTIIVNMYTDLNLHSADAQPEFAPDDVTPVGVPLPLYFTVRGQGSVVFRLPSGKRLYFGPPSPGRAAEGADPATDPLSLTGTHVRVLMEQSSLDIFGGTTIVGTDEVAVAARSQLVFEKWSYAEEPVGGSSVNTNNLADTWITFGQRSSFVFLSDNYQGVAEKWLDVNADHGIDLDEPMTRPGYGSIAFDPSCDSSGRMILEIARGQKPSGGDFTDAGFNLYGALLVPTLPATDRHAATILNADFRRRVYFNQRGGIRALMRVNSDLEAFERIGSGELTAETWPARPDTDRRGLVIINHNNSIPHFSNRYDLANSIDTCKWAQYNDYEPGFILGVNGEIEVQSHRFVDYFACNKNKAISSEHGDIAGTHASAKVKLHNPAALYTDTLPAFDRRSQQQPDRFGVPISDVLFLGHDPEFGTKASIRLQGNAALYVRSVAPFTATAVTKPLFLQDKHNGHYHLQDASGGTKVITVPLGIGQFDGWQVPVLDANGSYVMQATNPEGSHALDIEGDLTITSVAGAYGEAAAGVFKIPSVELDHAGQELRYTNFDSWLDDPEGVTLTQEAIAVRPLPLYHWFAAYDVSSVLCNAAFKLDNVIWVHDDVCRTHQPSETFPHPGTQTRPHIVGGELATLQGKLYQPTISLFSSTLSCHESLVLSGVALTVHERPIVPLYGDVPADANNTARIVCYNRGSSFDASGVGRILQFGSQANYAADGSTTHDLWRSAHLDVYRAAATPGATAEAPNEIRLSLENGFEYGVTAAEDGLHTLYLANESQIHLGWPTLEGDSSYAPNSMDDAILSLLKQDDPQNNNGYRFNVYETGRGKLCFNGGPFCIAAGDALAAAPPDRPVPGADVGGVVYVNHGGALNVQGTYDLYIDTVFARRTGPTDAAMGLLTLPRDQTHYLANGARQNYAIDFTAHQQISGDQQNHVLLEVDGGIHLFDVQQSYPGEDDEPFEQGK